MENLERDLASQRVPRSVYCPWLSRQVTGAQGPLPGPHQPYRPTAEELNRMANETICFLRNDLDKEKKENERLQDLMKDCEGFTPRVHVCFQLLLHVPSFFSPYRRWFRGSSYCRRCRRSYRRGCRCGCRLKVGMKGCGRRVKRCGSRRNATVFRSLNCIILCGHRLLASLR